MARRSAARGVIERPWIDFGGDVGVLAMRSVPGLVMAQKLQPGEGSPRTARHDLGYSLTTLALGTLLGVGTTCLVLAEVIPLTTAWPGVLRCGLEVVGYVVLFDAYFYGLHRALHTPVLYRRIHAVHHRSTAPTVLTALAFHPVEGLLILAFMPVAMWLIPIHLASLAIASAFLSGSILVAHCGYQVFPRWWEEVPVLNWYVTPRVHDAHHVQRDCNFSATLSIFDRAFGTQHRDVPLPE